MSTRPIHKVCLVTGSRAEYGLLRWVMQGIQQSKVLELQLIVTGMHLSPEFGLTVQDIEANGFQIDRKVDILLSSDTPVGITKSMGLGLIGFSDALDQLQPDILLVLGDRYEIFVAAVTALISRVPIAHIHGGELTEGAFDDAIRHSITKMSHIHFVAADEYRKRVIQLGEHPENVHNVGGLGIDAIKRIKPLNREELEASLDFKLGSRNLLITFHPVTLEDNTSAVQMCELLKALDQFQDIHFIFTMPNADTNGRILIRLVEEYCSTRPYAKSFKSLGQLLYFSCLYHFDGVVGNSSSGLLEVPSFRKGTVNIGDRQNGRLKAISVIDCDPTANSIASAISHLYSSKFSSVLHTSLPSSQSVDTSQQIVHILENMSLPSLKKTFYDIPLFSPLLS